MYYIDEFEVFNYVKNILNEEDVECLIEAGKPDYIYNIEVEQICLNLFKHWNDIQLETLFSYICRIIKFNFRYEELTQEKNHIILDIAYKIWFFLFFLNIEQEDETYEESEEDIKLELRLNSANNNLNKVLQKIEKLKKNLKKTKTERDNYKNKYDEVLGQIRVPIEHEDQSSVEGVDMAVNGPRSVPLMPTIFEYKDISLQLQLNSVDKNLNKVSQKIKKLKKKLKKTKIKRDKYDEILGQIIYQIKHEDQCSVEGVDMAVNDTCMFY